MAVTITINMDPAVLSRNKKDGRSWQSTIKYKNQVKLDTYNEWLAAGRPQMGVPVVADILVKRGRVMDDDNITSGLKAARDVLCAGRIVPSDTKQWFVWGTVRMETGKIYKGRESVTLTIRARK